MEIICLGFLLGIVFSIVTFGGCVFYVDRMDKRKQYGDYDRSFSVPDRDGDRCSHIKYIKQVDDQELASILDSTVLTGISVSPYEEEYLKEAANRLREEKNEVQ